MEAFYPIIFANFLSNPEKLGKLIASPGDLMGGGGGGGGAAAAAASTGDAPAKEEAKEEEVEMDLGGGMDMFGGDEEGGAKGGECLSYCVLIVICIHVCSQSSNPFLRLSIIRLLNE